MEKPTPFSLIDSLRRWREHVNRLPTFERENIDELETHLRDSLARLQAGGLSEQEAWLVALKRLGYSDALEHEFAKLGALTSPEAMSVATGTSKRQNATTRVRSLFRSLGAVVGGLLVTMGISYLAESKLLSDYYDRLGRAAANPGLRASLWPNLSINLWTFVLLSALAGGYVAALLARRSPIRHALVVGACMNLYDALVGMGYLMWVTGTAVIVATFLGGILREWQRRTWQPKWPKLAPYRILSRRTGVLSVWLMIAAIVVGLAEWVYPRLAQEWLQPLQVWLIWAAASGWIVAFSLLLVGRFKFKQRVKRVVMN
ncbi:MAG: hypothetical protein QOF48_3327 [Verrucomicrobiota bacterium]|jgi:hypothetical protein